MIQLHCTSHLIVLSRIEGLGFTITLEKGVQVGSLVFTLELNKSSRVLMDPNHREDTYWYGTHSNGDSL